VLFIGVIWVVFLLDRWFSLEQWGLIPRTLGGLTGLITMPFLHGDLQHITANTVPLAILLLLLGGSRADSLGIVVLIGLIGGFALWLFGRSALHIGASLLVFGLIGFLVCAGFFERRLLSSVIAIGVALTYGSTVLAGVLPLQRGVSWEGHLFGLLAGALVAWIIAGELRQQRD